MQKVIVLSVVLLFIFLLSCYKKIEEIKKVYKFGWAKAGNKLYYDYYTAADTLKDYRYLSIYSFNSETSCREEIPIYDTTSLSSNTLFFYYILNRDFVIKEDGLYEMVAKIVAF